MTVLVLSSEYADNGRGDELAAVCGDDGGGDEDGEGLAMRSGPRLRSPALIVVQERERWQ